MSHPAGTSLLDFVDSPMIVGDPDGRVIYVNPCCQRRLEISGDGACGESLASLFEGGSREAVLKAVAEVCTHGQTSHFKLRECGYDYLAQASPIEAEGDRVGVVILMVDEPAPDVRLLAFPALLAEPVDETIASLLELAATTSDASLTEVLETGIARLGELQRLATELKGEQHAPSAGALPTLDPVRVARHVAGRIGPEMSSAGCELDLLVPRELPAALGEVDGIEAALVELFRHLARQAGADSRFTLSARVIGRPGRQSLLFSVVHLSGSQGEGGPVVTEPAPRQIRDRVEELGGSLYAITSAGLGAVCSLQLKLAR